MIGWTDTDNRLTQNLNYVAWRLIAGNGFDNGPVPEAVRVVFRKYKEHRPFGDKKILEHNVANSLDPPVIGTRKMIMSTAWADFTRGNTLPDNNSFIYDLKNQIGADYYASMKYRYDRQFMGMQNWVPCGYDDHILWSFGARRDDETYEAQTRVVSSPYNFGTEVQWQQDPSLEVIGSFQIGTTIGAKAKGAMGNVSIDGNIIVRSKSPFAGLLDGTLVALHWNDRDNTWYDIAGDCTGVTS
jgi:hypothetical protein